MLNTDDQGNNDHTLKVSGFLYIALHLTHQLLPQLQEEYNHQVH